MFKNHPLLSYLKYSIAAAIVYAIAAAIYIHLNSYNNIYILYIGNFLFGCCIATFILLYNKSRSQNANAAQMLFAGHITAAMGVIIAVILNVVILLIFAPAVFQSGSSTSETLAHAPSALQGTEKGLVQVLFANAVIGNISAGSFFSIILPYSSKRLQEGETNIPGSSTPVKTTKEEMQDVDVKH